MKKVLILCTGNSCRSQIAEGFLRKYAGEFAEIFSAGLEAHGLNPRAVATMKATGIDISSHSSDVLDKYLNIEFDYIITVCDHANELCPVFPGKATRIHQSFSDPAKVTGSEEFIRNAFQEVRDQIDLFCKKFSDQYLLNDIQN